MSGRYPSSRGGPSTGRSWSYQRFRLHFALLVVGAAQSVPSVRVPGLFRTECPVGSHSRPYALLEAVNVGEFAVGAVRIRLEGKASERLPS
jgi:hypothetical protein